MVLLSGRWRALIVYYLDKGPMRFNALQRALGPISQRMLTRDLRELEAAGVVRRTVYAEVPPRVEYELTAWGRSLEPVLLAMCEWGQRYHRRLETRARQAADAAADEPPNTTATVS